jgi:hypothetical protein
VLNTSADRSREEIELEAAVTLIPHDEAKPAVRTAANRQADGELEELVAQAAHHVHRNVVSVGLAHALLGEATAAAVDTERASRDAAGMVRSTWIAR